MQQSTTTVELLVSRLFTLGTTQLSQNESPVARDSISTEQKAVPVASLSLSLFNGRDVILARPSTSPRNILAFLLATASLPSFPRRPLPTFRRASRRGGERCVCFALAMKLVLGFARRRSLCPRSLYRSGEGTLGQVENARSQRLLPRLVVVTRDASHACLSRLHGYINVDVLRRVPRAPRTFSVIYAGARARTLRYFQRRFNFTSARESPEMRCKMENV